MRSANQLPKFAISIEALEKKLLDDRFPKNGRSYIRRTFILNRRMKELHPPNVYSQSADAFRYLFYTLKRKWITSPSLTMYSFPSRRYFPASRAAATLPSVESSS